MRTIILLLTLGNLVAVAAPRLTEDAKVPVFFPTVVGDRWVLAVSGEDRVTNFEEVIAVSEKDGVKTIVVARLRPDGSKHSEYTVEASANGVCVVAAGTKKYEQPTWLIKNPTKTGSQWELKVDNIGDKPATFVYKIVGEEMVKTPAGELKAVRFDCYEPGGELFCSEWFAPGRGRIQQISNGTTVQLKSFTQMKK